MADALAGVVPGIHGYAGYMDAQVLFQSSGYVVFLHLVLVRLLWY